MSEAKDMFEFWDDKLSRGYIDGPLGGITHVYKEVHSACKQMIFDAVMAKTQLSGSNLCYRDTMIHVGNEKGLPPYSSESTKDYGERLCNASHDWSKAGTTNFHHLLQPIDKTYTFSLKRWWDNDVVAEGTIPAIIASSAWPSQFAVEVSVPSMIEGGAITAIDSNSRMISKEKLNDINSAIDNFKPVDHVCRYVSVQSESPMITYVEPSNQYVKEFSPQTTTHVRTISACSASVGINNRLYYVDGNELISVDLQGLNKRTIIPIGSLITPKSITASTDKYGNVILYVIHNTNKIAKIIDNGIAASITTDLIDLTPYGFPYDIAIDLTNTNNFYLGTSGGMFKIIGSFSGVLIDSNRTFALSTFLSTTGTLRVLYSTYTYGALFIYDAATSSIIDTKISLGYCKSLCAASYIANFGSRICIDSYYSVDNGDGTYSLWRYQRTPTNDVQTELIVGTIKTGNIVSTRLFYPKEKFNVTY